MDASVHAAMRVYAEAQTPENFHRLRYAVAATSDYQPYSTSPSQALAGKDHTDFAEATKTLLPLIGNWFLNPGIHQLLSFFHHKMGNAKSAELEFALSTYFINGILSTGDGSEERPYHVLHTADEYDILEHLGKKSSSQSLILKPPTTALDRQACEDGSVLWFDVSIPYGRLVTSRDHSHQPDSD